ncbi:MAG: acylphosphatase [Nitrospirae bacterium]|nr:acylphosphatase [Nitrospirota bacterium]
MKTRVHLYISGRVQGVFFRDSARQTAHSAGVTGFVKNLRDSRVEVVAEGEDEAIKKLVQWCHSGPPAANVESVEIHYEPYNGEFFIFEVRR